MGDGAPISAIYLARPGAKYTVLYSHANAVDLGDIREFLAMYRDRGFSVFSYDYRGYGTSPGRPTSRNPCKAADAALKHLKGLTSLRQPDLRGAHVTDEGVKRLQQALPNCTIEH